MRRHSLYPKRTFPRDEPDDNNTSKRQLRLMDCVPIPPEGMNIRVKSEEISDYKCDGVVLKNRGALSPKDLPPECQHGFRIVFRPAIRDFVATLRPWQSLADKDVARIWNDCFPKRRLEGSGNLHTIVSKLVEDTIQCWRRDMATTAVKCLDTELKSAFSNQRERMAHATWLLGDDDKDRKRPFYYKKYENGIQPSGIFQSPIIAATLASHVLSVSRLPEESRTNYYPTGETGPNVAKTGVESIPKTAEGHFSRANWGDHYRAENGRYTLVKTASNIVAVIEKLKDIQWARILAEAEKFAAQKNTLATFKALLAERGGVAHSDFEIEDWDDEFE